MMRLLLVGAGGRLGQSIDKTVQNCSDFAIAARVDPALGFDFADVNVPVDAVIDVSAPQALPSVLDFCVQKGLPLVVASTGHAPAALEAVVEAGESIPILVASNLSRGAVLLGELSAMASLGMGESADCAIVENHHRHKKDAPSGTALYLQTQIGHTVPIASVRGGGVPGIHEVLLLADHETVTLTHTALSRQVFAEGALEAARWIVSCAPGYYQLQDWRGVSMQMRVKLV